MNVFRNFPLSRRLPVLALAVSSTTLLLVGVAQADGHEKDAARLKYRQSLMSIVGTNMGAIGDIMKNQLALPGAIANHAGQMAESAALIAGAFEHEITDGPTDAKPEIWQDWAKFEKAIADYQEAARGLQTAAASGDPAAVGPAMKALGKSCGGCHKPFRKPKEESYKNQ
jgi:cytochrome c556